MKIQDRRQHIEHQIVREESLLRECADLLKRCTPLTEWPRDVISAFLLALHVEGEGRESYKAHRTARHLRLNRKSIPPCPEKNPTPLQRRCAERIRADLPSLTRLGAGSYLEW